MTKKMKKSPAPSTTGVEEAKSAAARLRKRLADSGIAIPQALSLEAIAAVAGAHDWNTLAASGKPSLPTVRTVETIRLTIAEACERQAEIEALVKRIKNGTLEVEITDWPSRGRGLALMRDVWCNDMLDMIASADDDSALRLVREGFAGFDKRPHLEILGHMFDLSYEPEELCDDTPEDGDSEDGDGEESAGADAETAKLPRLHATVTLQTKVGKNYAWAGDIEIDVTDLLDQDAETLKALIADFDEDASPYLERLPSTMAEALSAAHGGPTEVSLGLRTYLLETLAAMGKQPDDKCYVSLDWLTDDLLKELRMRYGFRMEKPAVGKTHSFHIGGETRIVRYTGKGWTDAGTADAIPANPTPTRVQSDRKGDGDKPGARQRTKPMNIHGEQITDGRHVVILFNEPIMAGSTCLGLIVRQVGADGHLGSVSGCATILGIGAGASTDLRQRLLERAIDEVRRSLADASGGVAASRVQIACTRIASLREADLAVSLQVDKAVGTVASNERFARLAEDAALTEGVVPSREMDYEDWLDWTGKDDSFVGSRASGTPGTHDLYEAAIRLLRAGRAPASEE